MAESLENLHSDPTLKDLLGDIWKGRLFILVFAILTMVAGTIFVYKTPGYYRASMVIGPALAPPETVSPQLSEPGKVAFTSPASFLQHRNKDIRRDSFGRLEVILKGQAVAKALSDRPEILEGIRLDRWNFNLDSDKIGADEIREYFQKTLDVREIGNSGMFRMIYTHPSPEFARTILKQTFLAADTHIKYQDRSDINNRIAHLTAAMHQTNNQNVKSALAFLLTMEDQRLMLVSSSGQYAGQIVDPVSLSSDPVWPKLSVFLVFGLLFGGFVGYAVFALWRGLRS